MKFIQFNRGIEPNIRSLFWRLLGSYAKLLDALISILSFTLLSGKFEQQASLQYITSYHSWDINPEDNRNGDGGG